MKFNRYLLYFILIFSFFNQVESQISHKEFYRKASVIKNPKHIQVEKNFISLKKIKSINEELGGHNYLFTPVSLDFDQNSNFYIFDRSLSKIFKFDKHFQYLKSFGKKGNGPGEFTCIKSGLYNLKIGRDELLYLSDSTGRRINVFDLQGNFKKGYRMNQLSKFSIQNKQTIIDANGNIFSLNLETKNTMSVYNQYDKKITDFKVDKETLAVLFDREYSWRLTWLNIHPFLSKSGKLLIYFPMSSILYVFNKNNELKKKIKIWPKICLNLLAQRIDKTKKTFGFQSARSLFHNAFIDINNEIIYFHFPGINYPPMKEAYGFILEYNLEGHLNKTLVLGKDDCLTIFVGKINNYFVSMDTNQCLIDFYKEEINDR